MVRLEERPWRAQGTLLLDTRARAHLIARGHAADVRAAEAGSDTPPPDSLEWLIEAAASIGSELIGRGATLRVITDARELTPTGHHDGLGRGELLDRLAGITPSRLTGLGPGIELLTRVAGEGSVIALLGAIGPEDAAELVRARSGPTTDLAVLADIGRWAESGAVRGRRPAGGAARSELTRQQEAAADLLRAGGWQVAVAGAEDPVAAVWAQLGRGGAVPAGLRGDWA
jgi:hypothetical protein